MNAHDMRGQVLNWPYCKACGLVALRNDATRRALKRACPARQREAEAQRLAARKGWK